MTDLLPIWDNRACLPSREVLQGVEAELALSLSAVVWGRAKPPYNDAAAFFQATHLTQGMKIILENILGRLTGTKKDVNPVIVLDVGFGGGKTHTLVTLYYAAKYPDVAANHLEGLPSPNAVRVVAISGDEYGETGLERDGRRIRTIWGDLFWQLGIYSEFERLDREALLPSADDVRRALQGGPVLILLDELPAYLRMAGPMMGKAVQFIQRLVLALSEKDDAAMVVAIAEDVYRSEAERTKVAIDEAAREAAEEARAQIRRKEMVMVPIAEEDVVHILKRRLFQQIDPAAAEGAAEAYQRLYARLQVPDRFKSSAYREEVRQSYPFHPELIRVLYERVATLDRFQRTRGALRLLTKVIRRIWDKKEADACLIHPFHVDLADETILNDLTIHIGEARLRNACEGDIWNGRGDAVAQRLDAQSESHWGAPLVRRTCNTIYLYSLIASGREAERGIASDLLAALCTTPKRPDHYLRIRDTVLTLLLDQFQFIDRRGERLVFIREPTPTKVIDLLSRDITEDEVTRIIREEATSLFTGPPDWLHIEPFPDSPAGVPDEPYLKVALLNPNLYTISEAERSERIPHEPVRRFMLYRDEHGKRSRQYINTTFLLVASEEQLGALRLVARKNAAARLVSQDPLRYGIPRDRKTDIEEYLARQQKNLSDYTRAAFVNLVYMEREGPRISVMSPAGYGNARAGREVIAHQLMKTLSRVVDAPLEPSLVLDRAWPTDKKSVTTKFLYEQFHSLPGLITSATKEQYQETIKRGVTEALWVLKVGDRVYTHERPPKLVPIDETAELLTIDEAERRGLLKSAAPPVIEEAAKPVARPITEPLLPISLSDAPLNTLADDLERRARRDRFNLVRAVTITMRGNQLYLLNVKNLLTRLAPERKIQAKLDAELGRNSPPEFSLHMVVKKEEVSKEEGASLIDLAWKLKGVEHCDIKLSLEWEEGVEPEQASRILRILGEGSKEPPVASLEAIVGRRS